MIFWDTCRFRIIQAIGALLAFGLLRNLLKKEPKHNAEGNIMKKFIFLHEKIVNNLSLLGASCNPVQENIKNPSFKTNLWTFSANPTLTKRTMASQ